jgi:site-specific DNA recombinase
MGNYFITTNFEKMKIADLYIRVSTDEQADKGYSQRNQEEVLRRYCEANAITVRKAIFEDHSAKTFNRPAWATFLKHLYKHKGETDLVLFTKWDRFSRNAADAYQMINTLRKLGIEPQAIEQPLDLSIPENKMMLAFYLAAPEVENDRRALNVTQGMRRAKKEGRWMGCAPTGYMNRVKEDGRKYIAPNPPASILMQWVFEQLATSEYNTEQVWKQVREKGLKCSKNNFWVAIRNPVYCGKIFVPKYKDEESRFVIGQHEPIISEALFYEVQEVLDGKRKMQRRKIHVDDRIPLRGFLVCPRCGRMLTGSGSKGRKKRYYYYHCSSACGVRYRAELVNKEFVRELRKYIPHPAALELHKKVIREAYDCQAKDQKDNKKRMILQVSELNNRITKARELLLSGDIEATDFRTVKTDCEKQITVLEAKLAAITDQKEDIAPILDKAVNTLARIDSIYEAAGTVKKRQIAGSIFPEKLIFDGENYRTAKLNEAVQLIYTLDAAFREKENGTSIDFSNLSHEVIPLGLEPRTHTLKVYCSTN